MTKAVRSEMPEQSKLHVGSMQKVARGLRKNLPDVDRSERRRLIICMLKCVALHNAVVDRSIHRKYAGRKPAYSIAVLLVDIVADGVCDMRDLDRLSSGSYWEGRMSVDDSERLESNKLERCTRAVLDGVGIQHSTFQTQARHAKKIIELNK